MEATVTLADSSVSLSSVEMSLVSVSLSAIAASDDGRPQEFVAPLVHRLFACEFDSTLLVLASLDLYDRQKCSS